MSPWILLLLPIAAGGAEFADIQAARYLTPLGVMLVYRTVALLLVLPLLVLQPLPVLELKGIGWCVVSAVLVALVAPLWLRASNVLDGAVIAALTSASPAVVGILAYLWRQERPTPIHLAYIVGMMLYAYGLAR